MYRLIFLCVWLSLVGCNGLRSVKEVFTKTSPYEDYMKSLEKSELDKTAMGKLWLKAGREVFEDSVMISLPFTQAGYFKASDPTAYGFQFDGREGQVIIINGSANTGSGGRLFIDLFGWNGDEWEAVAYADSTLTIKHEFDNTQRYLIRLQPELLIDLSYTINITVTPALANPVSGATNRSIRSIYGDARDGGNRRHEGVDIFAPMGTPVIAPTDGYISRVGTNKLGGKVIWMRDRSRSHSYYFAHLDSQLVKSGTRVKQYDTIGLVGNTGNARTTPPHLHFGIYQRGSKDPIDFIRFMPDILEQPKLDTTITGRSFRIAAVKSNIRTGPGTEHDVITSLKRNTYLKVVGKSGNWYHIILPDNKKGYIFSNLVHQIENKVKTLTLDTPAVLLSGAGDNAVPLKELVPPMQVDVLAYFDDYQLIKAGQGITGWILIN